LNPAASFQAIPVKERQSDTYSLNDNKLTKARLLRSLLSLVGSKNIPGKEKYAALSESCGSGFRFLLRLYNQCWNSLSRQKRRLFESDIEIGS